MILADATVLDGVRERLEKTHMSCDYVFFQVMEDYLKNIRQIDDPYLRERAVDIEDVSRRVVRNLHGSVGPVEQSEEHIVLAHDLTPSDTATMARDLAKGFATEIGSKTSHTAILARSLGIPAVVGLGSRMWQLIPVGSTILLDGYKGLLIVNPTAETLAEYRDVRAAKKVLNDRLEKLREQQSITRDQRKIILSANIEFASEMQLLQVVGGDGVGLFRTEFLYLGRSELPDEAVQFESYRRIAEAAGDDGVIVRTCDLGGDKISAELMPVPEPNPFLGFRGIRVSLNMPDMFRTQLRAILRASAHGNVRIMFPMVSCLEEVLEAKGLLEECREKLRQESIPFDENLEVGVMIEIPSAAMIADDLAQHVDFFSIGTNDLVQYSLAVDRTNERVAHLYRPCHPAIIRLLKHIVDAAHRSKIWVGVCGEMAGDVELTPIMVGLGLEELSVAAAQIPTIKHAVRHLHSGECTALISDLLELQDAASIRAKSREVAMANYPELLA